MSTNKAEKNVVAMHFMVALFGIPAFSLCTLHTLMYGFDLWNTLLITFIVVNLVICWWELALHVGQDLIQEKFNALLKTGFYDNTPEGQKKRDSTPMIFDQSFPLEELLQTRFWSNIWVEYCRFDQNYANPLSFQYVIDVMNAFSSFLPNIFFLTSMFIPIFSAQIVGIVGVMTFYQKWYGTVMYIFTFHNNGLHKKISKKDYYTMVLGSNGIWLTFPIIGFIKAVLMITSNTYASVN